MVKKYPLWVCLLGAYNFLQPTVSLHVMDEFAVSSHMGFFPTVTYCVKYATEVGGGEEAGNKASLLVTKSECMRLTL